ncbi:hypothetical protein PGT21_008847 [Puccinia graminis f. sp. tritici]|uniref:Uncharacterized protein n=1 Tax=Puccinia graminis f. sp. tritici TaxID=56615 RepID=A0A5B0QEW3_PUCGR|nr:hypothetical protein PGT21_008847 [Puccinia graminis f. sp. tritici]
MSNLRIHVHSGRAGQATGTTISSGAVNKPRALEDITPPTTPPRNSAQEIEGCGNAVWQRLPPTSRGIHIPITVRLLVIHLFRPEASLCNREVATQRLHKGALVMIAPARASGTTTTTNLGPREST